MNLKKAHLDAVLEETEPFCRWRQQQVAKIVQVGLPVGEVLSECLGRSAPRIFGAQRHSDYSAVSYTLTALRGLGDDYSWFNGSIISSGKNTDVEIDVPQFDLRCFVTQAYDHGDRRLWRS
jgi:hypothetical protein